MDKTFYIHLPKNLLAHVKEAEGHFYARLLKGLHQLGGRAELIERAPLNIPPDPFDGNFHFVHQGFHRQQNVLNMGPAYIAPYFYADTQGVFGESSLVGEMFDAAAQPAAKAAAFTGKLAEKLRYVSDAVELPERDTIVLLLQPMNEILERTTRIDIRELVRGAVAAAQGEKIIIWSHPAVADDQLDDLLGRLDRQRGNVEVTKVPVTHVLAKARVTVSYNSPHALEGMCLGVPAVFCAKTDLSHNGVSCHDMMEIGGAIEKATSRDWPHEAFVYWFLFRKMLNGGGPRFVETALRRIKTQGVNLKHFGIDLKG